MNRYLFSNADVYDSISVVELAGMFELTEARVYSFVSKMMLSEELKASLDASTGTIIFLVLF